MASSRRGFLKSFAAAAAGAATSKFLAGCGGGSLAPSSQPSSCCPAGGMMPARKPNIIFILADDLGYADLGCYGQKTIRTPNIDAMAAEGMRFTQHYAGSTVCAPSRNCLMTGQHTGHAWMRGNARDLKLRPDPQDVTVATLLKQAGYRTAMIGKSSASANIDEGGHPNTKGFDHFFGHVSHTAAHDYFPPFLYRDGEKIEYPNNRRHEGDTYAPEEFLRDAMAYIEQNKAGPFFLHYSTPIPHASLYAPPEWTAQYMDQFGDEPPVTGQRHYRNEPRPKAAYAGMVSRLDYEVGELLAKLRELGIEKNTMVFFASDNGAMSEGGHSRETFQSSGALNGGKRDLTEGGIRVPLIAWHPGTIGAGQTSDHVSAFWDFLPTVCQLTGAKQPAEIDGIGYAQTLLDQPGQRQHEYLYWEFHEQGGKRAVRMGNWKCIQLDVAVSPDGPVAVYDLAADPGEKSDVSAEHPDIVDKARRIFAEARTPSAKFNWRPTD